VRQKGNPFLQSCNRFLNEYENYCIINCLLELNSPALHRLRERLHLFQGIPRHRTHLGC
jgi:hypothetical protein